MNLNDALLAIERIAQRQFNEKYKNGYSHCIIFGPEEITAVGIRSQESVDFTITQESFESELALINFDKELNTDKALKAIDDADKTSQAIRQGKLNPTVTLQKDKGDTAYQVIKE